jgi:hypothetical protein
MSAIFVWNTSPGLSTSVGHCDRLKFDEWTIHSKVSNNAYTSPLHNNEEGDEIN